MIGTKLGHYRVIEKIGAGGMGEVYRAHDEELDRDVAIKILAPGVYTDQAARLRLQREARAAAALNHPHICTVHEVGEHDGRGFIVMECVDGKAVSDAIATARMSPADVMRYALQLADALTHAHEHGVIHRDFKAANIVMSAGGQLKVLDFGLAKRTGDFASTLPKNAAAPSQSVPGRLVGTPAYMSPEQLRGLPADSRSDIWALGVVLYEMAAGARPFAGTTWADLTAEIVSKAPPALPDDVPAALSTVIFRCLEKTPASRLQTAREVRAALEASDAQPVAAPSGSSSSRARLIVAAIAALVVIAAVAIRQWPTATPRPLRIAVLPFENLTGDANQEYFSDGLTDEMITQLATLRPDQLHVIARTSAMHYKKTRKSVADIGRELNVEYILEGTARREAGRVRINTELVRVADQTQLWAEAYEREFSGVLSLQSDVAAKIAQALAIKLLPAEAKRLARPRPIDAAAYENYLRGLQAAYKFGGDNLDTAQGYFEAALKQDPEFAQAWTGLALVWAGRQQMGFAPPAVAGPQQRAAATKALRLDPALSVAHNRMATLQVWTDWDYAAGEREFQRAIELDPSNAIAHMEYSHLLMCVGRQKESFEHIDRAIDLDPFNPLVRGFHGIVLSNARKPDQAIAEFNLALQISPTLAFANNGKIVAYLQKGANTEALAAARRAATPDEIAALDRGLAKGGPQAAWREIAAFIATTKQPRAFRLAAMYMRAGDYDHALQWLETACDQHDPNVPYLKAAVAWEPLRNDPRFKRLLRRAKLM